MARFRRRNSLGDKQLGFQSSATQKGRIAQEPSSSVQKAQQPRNQAAQIGKTIKRAIKLIKPFLSSHVDITLDPRSDTTLTYARLVKGWGETDGV